MKMPKNLGKVVTNASFILLTLAVVIAIGGRIFAQSSSDAQINVFYATESSDEKMSNLDTSYVDSTAALATFTEGQKCDRADNACLVKTTDNNRIFNAMFTAIGSPDATAEGPPTSSLFNSVGKMIAWTYEKPVASGSYYVAEALNNMGLAPAAYAQGYGYYALSPYLQIWRVFRNLAYIFFTVVVIVIGVLILFRQRIGGQAAVTAQQALPRIVIALLLVTFSYAIAGFMIDLMYWIMYAFSSFIKVNNVGGATTANELVNGGFGSLFKMVFWGNWDNIWGTTSALTSELFGEVGKTVVGEVVGEFLGKLAGGIAGILASLIIIIVLFVNLFRLLFVLLKSYAIVLLNIIFAPLNLMLTAIPGVNTFKKWIMSIIANLSPFVVTFFMIVIMGVTNSVFGGAASNSGQGFVPPYTLSPSSGSFTTSSVGTLVGLAIMLAMPQIVESIKKKLDGGGGFFSEVASAATDNFKKGAQTGKKVARVGRAVAAPIAGGIWGMANQQKLIDRGELDPEARGKWFRSALIGGVKASRGNKDFKIRNAVGARVIAGLGGAKRDIRTGRYGYVRDEYNNVGLNSVGKGAADYLEGPTNRRTAVDAIAGATGTARRALLDQFGGAVALSEAYRDHKYYASDIDQTLDPIRDAAEIKKQQRAIRDLNRTAKRVLGGDLTGTGVSSAAASAAASERREREEEFKKRVGWAKRESWREGGTGGLMIDQRKYDDSRTRDADMHAWTEHMKKKSVRTAVTGSEFDWRKDFSTPEGFELWRKKDKPDPSSYVP